MATITFNLPKSLDERITKRAKARTLSKSAMIRLLIQEHIESGEPPSSMKRQPSTQLRKGGAV